MAGVLFTIESLSGQPTLSEVAQRLHVSPADLDASYGIVLIDPKRHLYSVLLDEKAAQNLRPLDSSVQGPFSNPGIGLYGPVRPGDRR